MTTVSGQMELAPLLQTTRHGLLRWVAGSRRTLLPQLKTPGWGDDGWEDAGLTAPEQAAFPATGKGDEARNQQGRQTSTSPHAVGVSGAVLVSF